MDHLFVIYFVLKMQYIFSAFLIVFNEYSDIKNIFIKSGQQVHHDINMKDKENDMYYID